MDPEQAIALFEKDILLRRGSLPEFLEVGKNLGIDAFQGDTLSEKGRIATILHLLHHGCTLPDTMTLDQFILWHNTLKLRFFDLIPLQDTESDYSEC